MRKELGVVNARDWTLLRFKQPKIADRRAVIVDTLPRQIMLGAFPERDYKIAAAHIANAAALQERSARERDENLEWRAEERCHRVEMIRDHESQIRTLQSLMNQHTRQIEQLQERNRNSDKRRDQAIQSAKHVAEFAPPEMPERN
jgi:hypothetical protein